MFREVMTENAQHFHDSVDESGSEIVKRVLENSRNLALFPSAKSVQKRILDDSSWQRLEWTSVCSKSRACNLLKVCLIMSGSDAGISEARRTGAGTRFCFRTFPLAGWIVSLLLTFIGGCWQGGSGGGGRLCWYARLPTWRSHDRD